MGKISFLPYIALAAFAIVYAAPYQVDNEFSALALGAKVFPVLYLIIYVNSYLDSTFQKNYGSEKPKTDDFHLVRRRLATGVVGGFIFSCVGDGFLFFYKQWTLFLLGTCAFGVAQACYIQAFGFQVMKKMVAIPLYAFAAFASWNITRNAPLIFKFLLPVYGSLLITMVWRAIDRTAVIDGRSAGKKLSLAVGGCLFLASDFSLGTFKFVQTDMHYLGEYIVLATYYSAQGLIAIGVS